MEKIYLICTFKIKMVFLTRSQNIVYLKENHAMKRKFWKLMFKNIFIFMGLLSLKKMIQTS